MHGYDVPPAGLSGGLGLFWKKDLPVEILGSSRYFIVAKVPDETQPWIFVGVYGEPEQQTRLQCWQFLRTLLHSLELPYLLAGDFNEVTSQAEHASSRPRSIAHMQHFREFLLDFGLIDLGYEGYRYTWSNNRIFPYTVKARLDRADLIDGAKRNSDMSKLGYVGWNNPSIKYGEQGALVKGGR
ncbi:hypothetical protein M569_14253 [Genlisea aurea]|uniref:Endonuclease/exonuclease/phosphatase domain-containing protein n=1 Tax=Genlisea aurea TaxID=192259 RepID=S8C191_9LAMI|nr:hypothetical protein M569_14253 [Genlisea aurea]